MAAQRSVHQTLGHLTQAGLHRIDPLGWHSTSRHSLVEPGRSRGQGDAPLPDESPGSPIARTAALADTFSHQTHKKLTCITCHSTTSRKSTLTFQPPRGCQICHHQRPTRSDCTACHKTEDIQPVRPVTVEVTVPRHAPRDREVGFEHGRHADLACTECHTTRVTLEPEAPVTTCRACHDNHHTAGVECATCHRTEGIIQAHAPPAVTPTEPVPPSTGSESMVDPSETSQGVGGGGSDEEPIC